MGASSAIDLMLWRRSNAASTANEVLGGWVRDYCADLPEELDRAASEIAAASELNATPPSTASMRLFHRWFLFCGSVIQIDRAREDAIERRWNDASDALAASGPADVTTGLVGYHYHRDRR